MYKFIFQILPARDGLSVNLVRYWINHCCGSKSGSSRLHIILPNPDRYQFQAIAFFPFLIKTQVCCLKYLKSFTLAPDDKRKTFLCCLKYLKSFYIGHWWQKKNIFMPSIILEIISHWPLMTKEKHCKLTLLWIILPYFQTCVKLGVASACALFLCQSGSGSGSESNARTDPDPDGSASTRCRSTTLE